MTQLRGSSKEQVDKAQSPASSVILLWQYWCKLTNHHMLLPTGFSKAEHVIPGNGKRDRAPCSPTSFEDFWQCFTRLINPGPCSCDWQPPAVIKQGHPTIYSYLILREPNEERNSDPLNFLHYLGPQIRQMISGNSAKCTQTILTPSFTGTLCIAKERGRSFYWNLSNE